MNDPRPWGLADENNRPVDHPRFFTKRAARAAAHRWNLAFGSQGAATVWHAQRVRG